MQNLIKKILQSVYIILHYRLKVKYSKHFAIILILTG